MAYDYLPASQLGQILDHVSRVHSLVVSLFTPLDPISLPNAFPEEYRDWLVNGAVPPLMVQSVSTGQSIKFVFGSPGQVLPRVKFQGEHATLVLPRWTLAPALTGIVLTAGYEGVDKYITLQKDYAEMVKAQQEIKPIDPMTAKKIDQAHDAFKAALSTPNVLRVTINGVPIPLDKAPKKGGAKK